MERLACSGAHYRYYPFEYFLECQKRQGFTAMDFWAGPPHGGIYHDGLPDMRALRRALAQAGLRAAALSPECQLTHYSLCAYDPWAREKSLDYFANAIRAAAELGAPIAAVSCQGAPLDRDPQEARRNALETLSRLAPLAAEAGVILALETSSPQESPVLNSLEELAFLLDRLNHPNVRACLNLSAAACGGESVDEWFGRLGSRIVHVHFTDGRPGGALAWGDGFLPLGDCLEALNAHGYRGFLSLAVRDTRYLEDPQAADRACLRAFAPYLEGAREGGDASD
jgi:protein FrlC